VLRTAYQRSVAAYWNNEKDPVNIRLGEVDGLYHHHYGIGDYDPAVLEAPAGVRDQAIIAEMHRLETAQADVLLDHLGAIGPDDRLLACGRTGGRGPVRASAPRWRTAAGAGALR
jgi:geranyl diphosphate 2-C-methyltransferase